MVKITTRQQFDLLIEEMQKKPYVARGGRAYGESKAPIEQAWNKIAEKLNSIGPPMRTSEEWQRVWIHFKAKLKKKLEQRKKLCAPLGGSLQEVSLTSLEKAAVNLLQVDYIFNPQGSIFSDEMTQELQDPIGGSEPRSEPKQSNESGTKSELLFTMKKIEKHLCKNNEILKEMMDLKRKKLEVLTEIKEIKRMKYEFLQKDQNLNRKIKKNNFKREEEL